MSRILPDNYKSETYCYDTRNTNWTDYYLVPDLPRVVPPIDHRPRWKGVGKKPNQAHSTLIEVQPKDRQSFASKGFLPHTGEFKHFTDAVNQESSLRNLDLRLSNRAFGRRVIQELSYSSHDQYQILPDHRSKSFMKFEEPQTIQPECTFERKYDQEFEMNGARFNNSTRTTTRNLKLPYVKQSKRAPIQQGRPGYGGHGSNVNQRS
jgi:hypothetical protein